MTLLINFLIALLIYMTLKHIQILSLVLGHILMQILL